MRIAYWVAFVVTVLFSMTSANADILSEVNKTLSDGSGGAFESSSGVTSTKTTTDDVRFGSGTSSTAPFYFDTSTGNLTLNTAGASISTKPSETAPDCSTLLERNAYGGAHGIQMCASDENYTANTVFEFQKDGSLVSGIQAGITYPSGVSADGTVDGNSKFLFENVVDNVSWGSESSGSITLDAGTYEIIIEAAWTWDVSSKAFSTSIYFYNITDSSNLASSPVQSALGDGACVSTSQSTAGVFNPFLEGSVLVGPRSRVIAKFSGTKVLELYFARCATSGAIAAGAPDFNLIPGSKVIINKLD